MQTATTMLTKALQYVLVSGYSIIPVGKDKRPLLASWKEYQDRLPTEDEIKEWYTKWPAANIGIVTGKVSGITVVDVDSYKENTATVAKFPKTLTVKTGNGGFHLYYEYTPGLTVSANAYSDLPGVDIRSDGGFVVAPPSVTAYLKNGTKSGGEYSFVGYDPIVPFPTNLISPKKVKRTLSSTIGVATGGRNDSIASVIGKLLQSESNPDKFLTEVLPAVERINETYSPPLSHKELLNTFNSILKKEVQRRSELILSPIQPEGADPVSIQLDRTKSGTAYNNMANVLKVLQGHPYYKGTIRYNTFKQEIEYNGQAFEEGDLVKVQYFMQTDAGLFGISKEAVYGAVQHYANMNMYDEAKEWIEKIEWDGVERLSTWVPQATGVQDTDYHRGVGAQWVTGAVRRIVQPGATFDHVLVLVGGQGIGKTSFFRILGGKWYKSYTGAMDNKDFCLALRGALIVDLDEGAAMNRVDSIKLKSIVTETHDEFRAPYDRVMKKYPRRFVFSMSTNDAEPFRDVTGNRRYWTIDVSQTVNFKWLEENRDQIFAEAYHCLKNKIKIPEVPLEDALQKQQEHIAEDAWTENICRYIESHNEYQSGSDDFVITIAEVYTGVFKDESLLRLNTNVQMRISTILKNELGLEKKRKRIDGNRFYIWIIGEEKKEELRKKNTLPDGAMIDPFDIF